MLDQILACCRFALLTTYSDIIKCYFQHSLYHVYSTSTRASSVSYRLEQGAKKWRHKVENFSMTTVVWKLPMVAMESWQYSLYLHHVCPICVTLYHTVYPQNKYVQDYDIQRKRTKAVPIKTVSKTYSICSTQPEGNIYVELLTVEVFRTN